MAYLPSGVIKTGKGEKKETILVGGFNPSEKY
jgi:hypothetical protein